MKPTALRAFVTEVLTSHGAKTEEKSTNLLTVHAPADLAERLGTNQLLLAFNQRGLQEDPTSELATVGNPVFDRVLELALRSGSFGERFQRTPKEGVGAPDPAQHLEVDPGMAIGDPVEVYTPLLFHVFRMKYSLEDVQDDLEIIAVDWVSGEALGRSPDLVDLWLGLETTPTRGRIVCPALPVPEALLQTALDTLEHRLRRRSGRLRKAADAHMESETENIRSYYQQLIEETRGSIRRSASARTLESREEKIELLQLDWKRRIEEAQRFWKPRVDIALVMVASMQQPRIAFPIQRPDEPMRAAKRKTPRPDRVDWVYYDPTERSFVLPPAILGVKLQS